MLYDNDIRNGDDIDKKGEEGKNERTKRSIDVKYKFMNVISISGSAHEPLNWIEDHRAFSVRWRKDEMKFY